MNDDFYAKYMTGHAEPRSTVDWRSWLQPISETHLQTEVQLRPAHRQPHVPVRLRGRGADHPGHRLHQLHEPGHRARHAPRPLDRHPQDPGRQPRHAGPAVPGRGRAVRADRAGAGRGHRRGGAEVHAHQRADGPAGELRPDAAAAAGAVAGWPGGVHRLLSGRLSGVLSFILGAADRADGQAPGRQGQPAHARIAGAAAVHHLGHRHRQHAADDGADALHRQPAAGLREAQSADGVAARRGHHRKGPTPIRNELLRDSHIHGVAIAGSAARRRRQCR